jgi:hypothetical protein
MPITNYGFSSYHVIVDSLFQLISLQLLLVTVLQLRLQEGGTKAGGKAVRQGDVVPAEDHQVHGRQELLQTQTSVHGDVGQLPDLAQFGDRETRLLEELLGLMKKYFKLNF